MAGNFDKLNETTVEIPRSMPISGRKGAIRLERLRRRAEYLQKRIQTTGHELTYDMAEFAALEWVIRTMIMYEELLKKGPESEE